MRDKHSNGNPSQRQDLNQSLSPANHSRSFISGGGVGEKSYYNKNLDKSYEGSTGLVNLANCKILNLLFKRKF